MPIYLRGIFSLLILLTLMTGAGLGASTVEETVRDVTILYTNDFHSAFDPTPAYWLRGSPQALRRRSTLDSHQSDPRARQDGFSIRHRGYVYRNALECDSRRGIDGNDDEFEVRSG